LSSTQTGALWEGVAQSAVVPSATSPQTVTMQVGGQSRADDQFRLRKLLTRHYLTGWFQDRIGADTEESGPS
jgi:hypothetical protein